MFPMSRNVLGKLFGKKQQIIILELKTNGKKIKSSRFFGLTQWQVTTLRINYVAKHILYNQWFKIIVIQYLNSLRNVSQNNFASKCQIQNNFPQKVMFIDLILIVLAKID